MSQNKKQYKVSHDNKSYYQKYIQEYIQGVF